MTLDELTDKYVFYIAQKNKFGRKRTAKILGISERSMRMYAKRLKMPKSAYAHEAFGLKTVTAEERDFFENMDAWQ